MTSLSLAQSYLAKAKSRLKILRLLQQDKDYSDRLRKERELAFYGDEDFIPSEEYKEADGLRAIEEASYTVEVAERVIGKLP